MEPQAARDGAAQLATFAIAPHARHLQGGLVGEASAVVGRTTLALVVALFGGCMEGGVWQWQLGRQSIIQVV